MKEQQVFRSISELQRFSESFAKQIEPGQLIGLEGPLGAGKTTFVRFLVEALTSSDSKKLDVRSPTFGLFNEYPTTPAILHADLYRFYGKSEGEILLELDHIGFRDYLATKTVLLIEWYDLVPSDPYCADFRLRFRYGKTESERELEVLSRP